MKKIIFLSLICFPVFAIANTSQPLNYHDKCKLRGFNLLAYDANFKEAFDSKLMKFGAMKSTDFDKDGCINENNLINGILTAEFLQNKNKFVGQHLKSFVAFDSKNKEILVVLVDEESKSYVIGDKTPNLISALKSSFGSNEYFQKVDITSPLTFTNFNENYQTNKAEKEFSDVVEKRIEENKKLYKVAAEKLRKKNLKDLIHKDTKYIDQLKDGEGRKSNISVITVMDPNIDLPLSKKSISQNIYFVSVLEKIGLKNSYSFKPRSVIVKQEGALLKIGLEYTAQNSYGADVVGFGNKVLFLGSDGQYHPDPEK
ncbi:Uncharacterised protein [Acinetobacter baumannii]|nr:Uncharacterised protein [Acinetobacter baumannii]